MATRRPKLPNRDVLLERDADGVTARYPTQTYRFMFSDGATLDVVGAVRDDSDLRGAVLELVGGEVHIVGVAALPGDEQPPPEAPPLEEPS
jgi:hypothetical protein